MKEIDWLYAEAGRLAWQSPSPTRTSRVGSIDSGRSSRGRRRGGGHASAGRSRSRSVASPRLPPRKNARGCSTVAARRVDQPQIGLVDQRRRLQRVARRLVQHLLGGERARRLERALHGHALEAGAECRGRLRDAAALAIVREHRLEAALRHVDVGVAQERGEVVGIGAEARVLVIDDGERGERVCL